MFWLFLLILVLIITDKCMEQDKTTSEMVESVVVEEIISDECMELEKEQEVWKLLLLSKWLFFIFLINKKRNMFLLQFSYNCLCIYRSISDELCGTYSVSEEFHVCGTYKFVTLKMWNMRMQGQWKVMFKVGLMRTRLLLPPLVPAQLTN